MRRTFCLENPGSMTYTMPSMVSDVSAMLVDTTILRPGGPPGITGPGAGSKIFCCCAGGSVEYSGRASSTPYCASNFGLSAAILWHMSSISFSPVRKSRMSPGSSTWWIWQAPRHNDRRDGTTR
jgi:hypothetical protein